MPLLCLRSRGLSFRNAYQLPILCFMHRTNADRALAGQVGQIQGAHGIKGEVKVRSSTDFAVNRLCTPGIKHIKAPNRRFPRDVELVAGRWQKEEIFLLKLEVGCVALLWKTIDIEVTTYPSNTRYGRRTAQPPLCGRLTMQLIRLDSVGCSFHGRFLIFFTSCRLSYFKQQTAVARRICTMIGSATRTTRGNYSF